MDLDYTTVTPDEFDGGEVNGFLCRCCEHFQSCPFEGCGEIGYCTRDGEFVKATDNYCE